MNTNMLPIVTSISSLIISVTVLVLNLEAFLSRVDIEWDNMMKMIDIKLRIERLETG